MSVNLGSAHGSIEIDASGVDKGVNQATAALSSLTGIAGKVGGGIASGLAVAGTAFIGLGAAAAAGFAGLVGASTKAASAVESSLANIKGIKPDIDTSALFDSLSQMSTRVPQSAQELADGLYNIFSSIEIGQDDAVRLLETFSKGATAAMTDAETFGTAILGVMNAYGKSVDDAQHLQDVFFNTVNRGVITSEELAGQLGNVTGAAKQTGTSFEELGALIAGVTKEGGSAATNVNNLANFLNKLAGTKAQDALNEIGVATVDAQGNFRSVIDIVGDLHTQLQGLSEADFAAALTKIFPDVQAREAAIVLLNQLDLLHTALGENETAAGSADKAFQNMSQTYAAQSKILKNTVQATLQGIGKSFLPLATNAARGMAGMLATLQPALNALAAQVASTMQVVGERLQAGFAKALPFVQQFVSQVIAGDWEGVRRTIADAFGDSLIGIVAGRLARLAQLVADTFKTIQQVFAGQWTSSPDIDPIVNAIGRIVQLARDAVLTIQQVFAGDWVPSDKIQPVVDSIGRIAVAVRDFVIPAFKEVQDDAERVFGAVAKAIGSPEVQTAISNVAKAFADDILPAIAILLPKISDLAAKFAEVVAPEVAGRIATLAQVFKDQIAPAIATVADKAGILADKLKGAITPEVAANVGVLADALIRVAGSNAEGALLAVGGSLALIGVVIGPVVEKLSALIGYLDRVGALDIGANIAPNFNVLTLFMNTLQLLGDKIQKVKDLGDGDFFAGFAKGMSALTSQLGAGDFSIIDKMLPDLPALTAKLDAMSAGLAAKLDAMAATIGPKIGAMFSALGTTVSTGAGAALAASIGGMFSGLGTQAQAAVAGIGAAFSGLGATVSGALAGAGAAIGAFFSGLGMTASGAVAAIGAAFSGLGTAVSGALAAAGAGIGAFFSGLGATASGAVAGIGAAFSGLGAAVSGSLAAAGAAIGAFFSGLGGMASAAVATVGAAFSGLGSAASGAMSALVGVVSAGFSAVVSVASAAASAVASVVGAGFSAVVSVASSAMSAITSAIAAGWAAVVAAVTAAMSAILAAADAGWAGILAAASAAMAGVQAAVSAAWAAVAALVTSAMASLVSAIESGFSQAVALAVSFGAQMASAFSGLAGQLEAAAVAAMQGLINGIRSAGAGAVQAARDIAGQIAGAIGDALKIKSPSKVTTEMGEETSRGLAVGLKKGEGEAVDAATGVATSIAAAIAAILDALGKLVTFRGVDQSKIAAIGDVLEAMMTMMADAATALGTDGVTAAKTYGDAVASIVGAVADALDVLRGLSRMALPTEDQVRVFVAAVVRLVQSFGDAAAQFDEKFLDAAKLFADVASASVAVVGAGLESLQKLAESIRPTDQKIGEFKFALEHLVRSFGDSAIFLGFELLAAAKQFAEAASACVDVVAKGLQPLADLVKWVRPTDQKIGEFKFAVEHLVRSFADSAILLGDVLLDAAAAFSKAALASVEVLGPGIDGLAKLAAVKRLPSAQEIGAFKFAVEALVRSFADAAQLFATEALDAASQFAQAAQDCVALIGPALAGFLELSRGPIRVGDDAFRGLTDLIVRAVKAIAEGARLVAEDALAAARSFAESAGPVVQLVGTAVQAFVDLAKITAASGANLDSLKYLIVRAVNAIADAAKMVSGEMLDAARQFAEAAAPVVQLIGDAASAFAVEPLKEGEQPKGLLNPDQIGGLVSLIRSSMDQLLGLAQQYDRGQLLRLADLAEAAQAGLSALKAASDTFAAPAALKEGESTGPQVLIADLSTRLQQAIAGLSGLQVLADAFSARSIAIADQIAAAQARVANALSPFGVVGGGALAAGALTSGGVFVVRSEISYSFSPVQFQMMDENGGWIVRSLSIDGASRQQVADMVAGVLVAAAPAA